MKTTYLFSLLLFFLSASSALLMGCNGTVPNPIATAIREMIPDSTATAIGAGYAHTCAVTTRGVLCWGDNSHEQLGNATKTGSNVPVAVSGLPSGVTAISAGDYHTCVLTTSGGVLCWGDNQYGQLGNGTTINSAVPVAVLGLHDVTAIGAGGVYTCALTTDGRVWCWGFHLNLGNGSNTDNAVPVAVSGLSGVTAISPGSFHVCALTTDGNVLCWGANDVGQLGIGHRDGGTAPIAVPDLTGVTVIGAGRTHTCAATTNSRIWCWGSNNDMVSGNGTHSFNDTPRPRWGYSRGVTAIGGGIYYTCALTTNGGAGCWGDDHFMPNGGSDLSRGITAISAGFRHLCALTTGGGIRCSGWNYDGQLGDGTNTSSTVPVAVVGFDK